MMGFEVQDAVALLRLEDLFIDSFMVRACCGVGNWGVGAGD